jgi:hypothetical protein
MNHGTTSNRQSDRPPPPPPDRQEYTMNNLVAKHAHKYNRAKVFKSKKDYSRKRKDWFK